MRTTMIAGVAFLALGAALTFALLAVSGEVFAHCDTLDGPVVMDARAALEKGDVAAALKWVKAEHEAEIRAAFRKALTVRSKGPEARDLADMYFFETLVRLHRAGEGAPYTGLLPAGHVEPVVADADKAIASGSVDDLAKKTAQAAEKGVRVRFERVVEARKHKDDSVAAGREFVEAYVEFVHYVEGLHQAIAVEGAAHAHEQEPAAEGHGR